MNEPAPRQILVIDDEIFIRDLLSDFFTKLQFRVVAAPDGNAGITEFRKSRFDTVLVDLKMPGKSGIETLRELRQIRPDTPLIVMTGYPTIDSSIEALRLGAFDYIIKPFKLQELREVVDRAIREQELHSEIDSLREKVHTIEAELRQYRSAAAERTRGTGSYPEAAMNPPPVKAAGVPRS
jgi:two-component system response regulator AtoC